MKFLSKLRNRMRMNLIKNNRGQGATEYILLVAVVVAVVMMFKGKITEKLKSTTDQIGSQMDQVTSQ